MYCGECKFWSYPNKRKNKYTKNGQYYCKKLSLSNKEKSIEETLFCKEIDGCTFGMPINSVECKAFYI